MNPLNIVILAAGKGTRMHSEKSKVLHALAGKPLVQHVLDCAAALQPQQICVVYGHGGEAVPKAMQQYSAKFVIQEPQLGTGHAVQQAMPHLGEDGNTLVLYGDVPLIQHSTLHQMQQARDGLTLLTVNLSNPTGYGRIVRDDAGRCAQHRRGKRRHPRTARDSRSEYRHSARADENAARLAGKIAEQQFARRVLPHRHRRHGRETGCAGAYRATRP